MSEEFELDVDDLTRRMDGAMTALKSEFASLRTGRASSSMLDPIMVEAYGQKTPINQVGTVNVPEPRMVTINVLNGTLIMLPIPELNEERRKELSKVAAQYAEQARISIRNIRKDGMDQVKKYKSDGMSEDDQKFWESEVQEMTDDYVKRIDSFLNTKQDEIMQV